MGEGELQLSNAVYTRKQRRILQLFLLFIPLLALTTSAHSPPQISVLNNTIIDDCCCTVGKLVSANHQKLNSVLNDLAKTSFFRYFKLDLFSDCKFWVTNFLCGSGGCAICECDEDEVPLFWKQQKTDRVVVEELGEGSPLGWKERDPESLWIVETKDEELSYVNLQSFPESHTSYGKDGSVIWNRIYDENCFKVDHMCLEERVFYKLISGLHTSISTHIAKYWNYEEAAKEWTSNVTVFQERVGKYPDRIQNLYFAYLFLLRAVQKISPVIEKYNVTTGRPQQDRETKELLKQLIQTDLLCQPNFNESILFVEPEKEQLKQQLKGHFRNISLIMDCVSCEKCKVWGKLQVLGIGTAIKILLTEESRIPLQRNELIALINTLRQFSNSIEAIQEFLPSSSLESSNTGIEQPTAATPPDRSRTTLDKLVLLAMQRKLLARHLPAHLLPYFEHVLITHHLALWMTVVTVGTTVLLSLWKCFGPFSSSQTHRKDRTRRTATTTTTQ